MSLLDEMIKRCDVEQRIHLKRSAIEQNTSEMWEEFRYILKEIKADIKKEGGSKE